MTKADVLALAHRLVVEPKGLLRLEGDEFRGLVAYVLIIEGSDLTPWSRDVRLRPTFEARRASDGAGTITRTLVKVDPGPGGFPVALGVEEVIGLHLMVQTHHADGCMYVSVRGFDEDARAFAHPQQGVTLVDRIALLDRLRRAVQQEAAVGERLAAQLAALGYADPVDGAPPAHSASSLDEAVAVGRMGAGIDEQAEAIAAGLARAPIGHARFGHVRPIIHAAVGERRFVAVWGEVFHGAWNTFHDFLFDYIKGVLGREWWLAEQAKQLPDRHVIMQWNAALGAFMRANRTGGVTSEAVPDGPTRAYLLLAYDLFLLGHHAALQASLVRRLKHPDQFQGARHELFVAATLIRADFSLEFEDETDPSRRHPEFVATHRATEQQLAIEAKSRHRPGVLGRAGAREDEAELRLGATGLLRDAVEKAGAEPLVIFLDVNLPTLITGDAADRWLAEFLQAVEQLDEAADGACPWNLLVVTNDPYHFGAAGEPYPSGQSIVHHPDRPRCPVHDARALQDLATALRTSGSVPTRFP